MSGSFRYTSSWILAAFVIGATAVGGYHLWSKQSDSAFGIQPASGFVMQEADRRKSKAYLNFIYGVLYQERGQVTEAAERFAEACSLDQILQTNMEPEQNPS